MIVVKYRVKFTESERGWGSNSWYSDFYDRSKAIAAVDECNKHNPTTHVPDYYIQAEYIGPVEVNE